MNKVIASFICLSIVVAGCESTPKSSEQEVAQQVGSKSASLIKISGNVKFPNQGGIITLSKFLETSLEKVDSVIVNDDGTFELVVEVPAPNFYRLDFYQNQSVDVILNDQDIVVNVDGDAPTGEKEIIGSIDTELFEQLALLSQDFERKMAQLNQDFVRARSQGAMDRSNDLQQEFLDLNTEYAQKFKIMVWEMGPSVAAIYALEFLSQRNLFNYDEQYPFVDSVDQKFQIVNAQIVDYFHTKVARIGKLSVGMPAPEISLPNPDGEIVRLSSLKGKYVMIDFWAAWCKPCRMENPNVVRLYNKYNSYGFEVFGVSLDRKREAWLKAIDDDGLNWSHVSDLKYWNSAVTQIYDIKGIPLTYLIDKEGIIIAKNLRGKALEEKLEEIFG